MPARDFPRWSCKEKVFFFRHITPLLTKREVKTARYCPRTYTLPLSSRLDRTSLVKVNNTYSWFATTQQGGHVGGRYNRIYMKIEFGSQRREMLLFLSSNMAAVTSRTNQQYITWAFPTLCLTRKRTWRTFPRLISGCPDQSGREQSCAGAFGNVGRVRLETFLVFKKCLDCLYE